MKKNKGITLIALVITVIILLILAAVAVSMITGNDGLFSKANEAGTMYNESAKHEADEINELLSSEYFENVAGGSQPINNGGYNSNTKVNTPDTSKLPVATTKYVTWTKNNGVYAPQAVDSVSNEWYDYAKGEWANIKTTSVNENLEAYWVWIPRFAYRLPENGSTAKEIEVIFVKNTSKKGVLPDGTEVDCYYSTDTEITTGGTGLYKDATAFAKGTDDTKDQAWIVHPAFWWDNNNNGTVDAGEQLSGIWMAKFEPSNKGGKIEILPDKSIWNIPTLYDSFVATKAMQQTGGAIGSETSVTTIDSHIAKNVDWGAVAILSQSKYGIFNPTSSTGLVINGGDGTLKVWNNPNSSYITGSAGSSADASNVANASCFKYNTANGIKTSTTGNIYGVYDMAGGAADYVMGTIATDSTLKSPYIYTASGFTAANYPERKYYDLYLPGTVNALNRGKIGDATAELGPYGSGSYEYSWNGDYCVFVNTSCPFFWRGGYIGYTSQSGVMSAGDYKGTVNDPSTSFRPVLIMP